jgi:eukaryotic translation initiation factor 2C
VYEHPNRFTRDNAQYLINEWLKCCETVGITVNQKSPPIFNINAQLPVNAARFVYQSTSSGYADTQTGAREGWRCGEERYRQAAGPTSHRPPRGRYGPLHRDQAVSALVFLSVQMLTAWFSFGDIKTGVATQCLKSIKCRNAKAQYFANVLLK